MLDHARATGLQVIHLVVGSDYRGRRDFNSRMRAWLLDFQAGSDMHDFYRTGSPNFRILEERIEERIPLEHETVFRKRGFGAFNSADFENLLHELGIETPIVTGCVANDCGETTVRDAADRGFAAVIRRVADATALLDEKRRVRGRRRAAA